MMLLGRYQVDRDVRSLPGSEYSRYTMHISRAHLFRGDEEGIEANGADAIR